MPGFFFVLIMIKKNLLMYFWNTLFLTIANGKKMVVLNSGAGNYIVSSGKKYSYFAGNNYFGLAGHPDVKAAAIRAVEKYGINFSASRRTTGTADIHLELEAALAAFKGKDDAVAFASGYQGNSILLDVLKDRYTSVFIDQQAHSSIIAAVPAGATNVYYYDHCDAEHLASLLEFDRGSKPVVITDGLFPLTGEIAPLDRIFPSVARHNGLLVVDDAHATGILGETGKGTPEHFNLPEYEHIYQTETMSKALGVYGGFITGSMELTDMIRNGSATYQASTALSPPIAAAGIASLKILHDNPGMRVGLLDKARLIKEEITAMDFQTAGDITPIIPIIFDSSDRALNLSQFLEENGVIVPFMKYPVRKEMHLLRLVVSATHTEDQITELLELLKKWKKHESN
jgi:7-keto-8-aminopelargonate synthetase-like enzyme